MSSGLLGNYESDEEDGEDLLKDGFAVRQAIAQQFASAADFEDEELNEPEGLPESVEADGYAQDSYQLDLDDEVDDNDLAEAIQEAGLQGDEDTVAGLHAKQERRKAAIDASVEMSAVSAVPDSMEDSNGPGSGLDANELAAAILEAELEGDDETLERLRAEQARRDARGEHARERGVRSATSSVSDSLEVPVQVIGAIIGTGGAAIKQLSNESGAKMNFEKEEYQPGYLPLSRCCLISGEADAVAKAKQLLQEAISAAMAEQGQGRKGKGGKGKGQRKGTPQNLASDLVGEGAGGRAGFQQGICKWYAAGFCKFHSDTGCRNGLHNSDAALKAEADWVSQGPKDPPDFEVKSPVLLLLDLEGGGNKDGRDGEDEIIEVPVLSVCPSTGKELGRFHRFVRPGYWTREEAYMRKRFNSNCFNSGANAIAFPEVVDDLLNWLRELLKKEPGELRSEDFLFVTCGNWDVKSAIPRQCSNPAPGAVDVSLQKLLFSRWSNLKEVFRDFYKLPEASAPTGMRGMLKMLRIPLSGQHHLGMDDVSNLAKILQRLIHEGCNVTPTGQATATQPWSKGKGWKGKDGKDGKGKGKEKGKDKNGKGKDFRKGKFGGKAPEGMAKGGQKNGAVNPSEQKEAEDLGWAVDVGSGGAPVAEVKEPKLKPNQDLEDFLNGAPIPGSSWGDDEEPDKDEQPEPDPLAAPRARPGEDWTAFMDMNFEGEDEETGERSLKRPADTEGEVPGEGDGETPEPVLKAPRVTMASLLATLPAPKASNGGEPE